MDLERILDAEVRDPEDWPRRLRGLVDDACAGGGRAVALVFVRHFG